MFARRRRSRTRRRERRKKRVRPSWAIARPIVNQVVTGWYDLNHLAVGPEALQFISIFDDTADVWSGEDFRLVEGLSKLAWLSKAEDLEQLLRGAA